MGMKVNGTSGLTFPDTTTLASAGQASVQAWVNFNGTGTVAIRAAYNVASITDNGTGDYTINFDTALPDANYAVLLSVVSATATNTARNAAIKGTDVGGPTNKTTTAVSILSGFTSSATLADFADINVAIFR